jgi:hypothetical protein
MKKKTKTCGKLSRSSLENIIEKYFDVAEEGGLGYDAETMAEYIAENADMSKDEVKAAYGEIIEAAASFNEHAYKGACERAFFENELKESFHEFCEAKWERQMNETCDLKLEELYGDPDLSTFRKTTAYRNADQEGKYRMLWKFMVSSFSDKIDCEDELSDICMEIAMHDENQF